MQDVGTRSSYVAHGPAKSDEESRDGEWIGMEMQRHDMKAARHRPGCDHRHVTPFQILKEIRAWPEDEQMRALWEEYEQATRDRKSVMWSRSLKPLRDRVEEEARDEAGEDEEELITNVEPVIYSLMARTGQLVRLLEVAEGLHDTSVPEFLGKIRAQTWKKVSRRIE